MDEPGRLLVGIYALFSVAAGARASLQLSTQASQAPLAYTLSALAAVLYLIGTVALRRPGLVARRVARAACVVELAGVLAVGTLSLAVPGLLADQTVWSAYGLGYGFVPLALPVLALVWLHHNDRS